VAQLIVNDGTVDSLAATVTITAHNVRPVANAGPDQAVLFVGQTVQLDGHGSSDVDGDTLTYRWSFTSRPPTSQAAPSDGTLVNPTFVADVLGTYVAQLIVNDGTVDSLAATVTITAHNVRPVANAGANQTVVAGTTVQFDGSQSHDVDGDPLTYHWSFTTRPPGSAATLSDPSAAQPTFVADLPGTYVGQLIVNDGQVDSVPATSMITVVPATPPPPIPLASLTIGPVTNGQVTITGAPGSVVGGTQVTVRNTRTGLTATVTASTAGAFTATLVAQLGDTIALTSTDALGQTSTPTVVTLLPPDPVKVAPHLDRSVATDMATATAFLYSGPTPLQTGVAPGTIVPRRAAVLRGTVLDRNGAPLPGVTIAILNHPELGQTLSRADGMFDLAVNGGGPLTVTYSKAGLLSAQRQLTVPWQDYAFVPDVVLIAADPQVTTVNLAATTPIQVARGSVQSDADGTRQATLLFRQGTQAQLRFADGSTQPLSTLSVRATEYTVGPNGPKAMPAALPPTSAYTYAVELSADEATALGATAVDFSQPVLHYVENFLGFPVGGIVPVGFYDRQVGMWIPSDNGRIIKVLSITSGMANLDLDGSGQAASPTSLAALGITDAERQSLASLYTPGQQLWRLPIPHFSPGDGNHPFAPFSGTLSAEDEQPKQPPPQPNNPLDRSCHSVGSVIECQNQILGEGVDVTGTPLTLHYQSDRVPGRQSTLKIFLSGSTIPKTLKRIELEVQVAGRLFKYSSPSDFPTASNQTYTFTWDGQDAYGRTVQGIQPVTVRLGYVYGVVYGQPAQAARSFALYAAGTLAVLRPDIEFILWQTWTAAIGQWDARAQGLGGWSLNAHHAYAPLRQVLYLGNGQRRSAESLRPVIAPVAGTGTAGFSGDGGPATTAQLQTPWGIAGSPDGSLYIADDGAHRVRRVSPTGIITTVAGTGGACFPTDSPCGDGGPATAAQFQIVRGVAVGPDGSLYIADYARVRRVSPAGIITTVAGTGTVTGSGIPGFSGDGGPATAAQFSTVVGIAMGPDGSLYIADTFNARVRRVGPDGIITTVAGTGIRVFSGDGGPASAAGFEQPLKVAVGPDGSLYIIDADRIRRVGPDGIITTVAGGGAFGFSGDGGLATLARLNQPQDITVGPDGSLYIADFGNFRIRRVGPEGLITTLAGNGTSGGGGDGGPATAAQFSSLRGVGVGADGNLYIADDANHRIRRVTAALPGFAASDVIIPDEDGQELYVFTSAGRHLRTLHALTGAVRFQFAYDAAGHLASVTDGDGNVTTVAHDATSGAPTAITGPFGQQTTLTVDANGYLMHITNPASETTALTSTSDGLLTSLKDPRGHTYQFTYDAQGLLTRDADPASGFQALTRADTGNLFTVDLSTALDRTTTYIVESLSTGDQHRVNTLPDGTQTEELIGTNGSWTTTLADGTVTNLLQGPDPRFAMQAALPKSLTITTGGLTATLTTQRSVTLTDPTDPLSLTSQSETVQLNGRTFTNVYNATTKTMTNTSAAGRTATAIIDLQGRVTQAQVTMLLT
jgi:YD repeat-containing protein